MRYPQEGPCVVNKLSLSLQTVSPFKPLEAGYSSGKVFSDAANSGHVTVPDRTMPGIRLSDPEEWGRTGYKRKEKERRRDTLSLGADEGRGDQKYASGRIESLTSGPKDWLNLPQAPPIPRLTLPYPRHPCACPSIRLICTIPIFAVGLIYATQSIYQLI